MPNISAVIIAKNEELNIGRCLESLIPVCDEILVIDSGSSDKTKEICEGFPKTQFISTSWLGFSETKNYGNQLAKEDYILSLDADESLSPELQQEILNLKSKLTGNEAFWMPRFTNYCGTWINHCGWRPDFQLRLFPKKLGQWNGNVVHEKLELGPSVIENFLSNNLLHYSYRSLQEHIGKINTYTTLGVNSVLKKHRTFLITRGIFHGFFRFLKQFIIKSGFRDGLPGFYICSITGFMVFLKYLKAHEYLSKTDNRP